SDPNLFDELEHDYQPSAQQPGGAGRLRLLLPKRPMPLQEKRLQGYWRVDLPQLTLVQPAGEMVLWLRQEAFWSVGLLAVVVLVGAFLSDAAGGLLARQFRAVVAPVQGHPPALDEAMPRLAPSRLRELNVMVRLLNGRILRANNLARALQRSNRELAASQEELERLSSTDTLTGCFNRRELYRRLEEEIRRCQVSDDDLACVCFDIDHFKAVNDTYGHPTGDAVLRGVSHLVRSRLRSSDCFCRSGGEEFTLLLTSCPRDDARNVAELLRSSIADLWIEHEHTALRVTVSLGVTAFLADDDAESLLSRADRALYRAKQEGRDRVIVV
ncbi:MAG: GGDEF domain-containing protein, partial [Synechococcaceae cyanobacterium]|nr:GGDEF domain-containing protein [Synechococcaceae cyanobacterium]